MYKRKLFFWLIIILAVMVLLHPYFQIGIPATHDGNNHLVRFASYKIALKEGQFPPRLAPNLFDLYGYPVFNFNYPLANILSVPFSILKVPYELTFKIIVAAALLTGAFSLKKWLELIGSERASTIPAVLGWLFLPFVSSTIYFRGNIGEIIAYGLMPALFYITEVIHVSHTIKYKNLAAYSVIVAAFLLSHNVTVAFFIPILLLYALIRYGISWDKWKRFIVLFGLAIAMSLWFWLPAVAEMQYTNITTTGLTKDYSSHFVTFEQLLVSPLRFGFSVPGSIDGLSFNVGIITWLVSVSSVLVLISKWLKAKTISQSDLLLGVSGLMIILLLFLQTDYSRFIWHIFGFAEVIQFPWRLSVYLGLFVAVCIYLLWQEHLRFIRISIVIALIWGIHTAWQATPVGIIHRPRAEYDTQTITTDILAENKPKTFTYEMNQPWQPTASLVEGEGTIEVISWKGSSRTYLVDVSTPATIVEPTAYFLGWETRALKEGDSMKVAYIDNDVIRGRIAYSLEPGSYTISSSFTQNTWARLLGNAVSIIAIIIAAFLLFKKEKI